MSHLPIKWAAIVAHCQKLSDRNGAYRIKQAHKSRAANVVKGFKNSPSRGLFKRKKK